MQMTTFERKMELREIRKNRMKRDEATLKDAVITAIFTIMAMVSVFAVFAVMVAK